MIHLDLLSHCTRGHASISLRRRWPVAFKSESQAMAQGIALLHQHAEMVGFVLTHADFQAANAAYLQRTITRAIAARKARQKRKAMEALP